MKEEMVKIFDTMGGDKYDEGNRNFAPIAKNLSFLSGLVLKDLPQNARILCVGVGTGADIIDLSVEHPGWTFVGIEPAESMIKKCKEKLESADLLGRTELFHGFLSDYPERECFDAVICFFVMHFIKDLSERGQMYADMAKALKSEGILIISEISADFKSPNYPALLEDWKSLHAKGGAPVESLQKMDQTIEKVLGVIPGTHTEKLIQENGFNRPTPFFQSFLIRAWHAEKADRD